MKFPSFIQTWLILVSSPADYWKLIQANTKRILIFFVISCFILSLSPVVAFQTTLLPEIRQRIDQGVLEVVATFPQDLELTWSDHTLTSNSTQGRVVTYPSFIDNQQLSLPKNFAYFLPTGENPEAAPEEVRDSTFLLVTQSQVFVNNRNGNWSNYPLTDFIDPNQPLVVNKNTLPQLAESVKSNVQRAISVLSFLAWIILPIGFVLNRLLVSVLQAILLYVLFKLNKPSFVFDRAWKLSLLITLVATVVEQVASWLYPSLNFPMFAITFWSIAIAVYWTGRQTSSNA